ncbi:SufD family Fe-S cluster assembly protein [Candidatus Bipolaricaulota bacterium]|nr:SufD family Fe-S cluster assembly protein [Candidatus Bipolaricaulota bacterium]
MRAFQSAPQTDPVIADPLEFLSDQKETPAEGIESLDDLPEETKSLLDELGINEMEQRAIAGLSIQDGTGMIDSSFRDKWEKKGVVMAPMNEALKRYPEARERFMKLYDSGASQLAAYHTAVWNGGIFLWVKEGVKEEIPLHLFFLIQQEALTQAPHIVILAEPESEIKLIEGCTSPILPKHSLHLDMTEAYIEEGAKLDLTVLQNWPEYVHTRPTQRVKVARDARFSVTSVGLGPGKSNITDPHYWVEQGGRVDVNSIILGRKDSYVDLGGVIHLEGENSTGINNSKAVIMDKSEVITRGKIDAAASGTKGHISCDGLIMDDGSSMETYPGLSSRVEDAELSHEAAIGEIKSEELFYLMSRGLDEEEATQLIVQGFVEPVIEDLPEEYLSEIRKIIELALKGEK